MMEWWWVLAAGRRALYACPLSTQGCASLPLLAWSLPGNLHPLPPAFNLFPPLPSLAHSLAHSPLQPCVKFVMDGFKASHMCAYLESWAEVISPYAIEGESSPDYMGVEAHIIGRLLALLSPS